MSPKTPDRVWLGPKIFVYIQYVEMEFSLFYFHYKSMEHSQVDCPCSSIHLDVVLVTFFEPMIAGEKVTYNFHSNGNADFVVQKNAKKNITKAVNPTLTHSVSFTANHTLVCEGISN